MARYFTLQEATALLSKVERHVRDAVFAHGEYEKADGKFRQFQQRVEMTGGARVDRDLVTRIVAEKNASAMILKQSLASLEDLGVQIKDLSLGLADFPTFYKGEEVLLCWRLGESAIEYWHGLEEGFKGRKAIDKDFIANHTSRRT